VSALTATPNARDNRDPASAPAARATASRSASAPDVRRARRPSAPPKPSANVRPHPQRNRRTLRANRTACPRHGRSSGRLRYRPCTRPAHAPQTGHRAPAPEPSASSTTTPPSDRTRRTTRATARPRGRPPRPAYPGFTITAGEPGSDGICSHSERMSASTCISTCFAPKRTGLGTGRRSVAHLTAPAGRRARAGKAEAAQSVGVLTSARASATAWSAVMACPSAHAAAPRSSPSACQAARIRG
jgi:hypothetical protein